MIGTTVSFRDEFGTIISGECLNIESDKFDDIKWDEVPDDEWLILIYIKDNSPDKGIVIEDKSNPEKNISNEYKPSEIFKASDMMVDSLTQLLERERSKKDN